MRINLHRLRRRALRWSLALSATGMAFSSGCFDSEIGKRFREAIAPGLGTGLSAAVTQPDQAETGLREVWAAINNGLAAIVQPRNSTDGPSGGSSGSN